MIIDISSYQKVSDWNKVKATQALEGIYIKACEGVNAPDIGFDKKAVECLKQNIPFGFYHFATLNKADVVVDATSEAAYFAKLTKGFKTSLPHVLDIEKNEMSLGKDKVLLYIKSFFAELEKQGVKNYVLYSYAPFLNANLPDGHGLGNIALWIAAYAPKPIIPKGWTAFWLWQYTQEGFVNGIDGHVDLNKKPEILV